MHSYQNYRNNYTKALSDTNEIGYTVSVTPPLVLVQGLPNVRYNEVVYFETGEMGFVTGLSPDGCEVLVLADTPVHVGCNVARSGSSLEIPVGNDYEGKSIDSLGCSMREDVYITAPKQYMPIDPAPLGIDRREKITQPFETGVAVVDMMVPLGKGQRELVLGDRQTGKTEFLLQTLYTQALKGTLCIYANIGKKRADIKRVESFIKTRGIEKNVVILSTGSSDPLGMIYLTPYTAMTLAEYYVSSGRDVLLILDDLSTHAKFYREISLIGKRFPGRNSYPGDIFYSHSRLLERAGNYTTKDGAKSITCLVVAETVESDISGYIQTNLMSITDGHIYFDHELFEQGRRPAVNCFLSVTRVGRQTQSKVRWGINRELSSFMTLYDKTQRFIHFGAEINTGITTTLNMGAKILAFFDQPMGSIVDQNLQILMFCLIWTGILAEGDVAKLAFLRDKSKDSYERDPEFKKVVDTLLAESGDFNTLLGKIGSQSKTLLAYLDK